MLRYEHDGWQRTTKIFTSYDGATPAVGYEYFTSKNGADGLHAPWHAVTDNKVTFDADDTSTIKTVLQTDGLGRAVRTVREGMTEFIQGGMKDLLESVPKMTSLFTVYEYDEKDRRIRTTLPDDSVQSAEFEIKAEKNISCSTDPLGNVSVRETSLRMSS